MPYRATHRSCPTPPLPPPTRRRPPPWHPRHREAVVRSASRPRQWVLLSRAVATLSLRAAATLLPWSTPALPPFLRRQARVLPWRGAVVVRLNLGTIALPVGRRRVDNQPTQPSMLSLVPLIAMVQTGSSILLVDNAREEATGLALATWTPEPFAAPIYASQSRPALPPKLAVLEGRLLEMLGPPHNFKGCPSDEDSTQPALSSPTQTVQAGGATVYDPHLDAQQVMTYAAGSRMHLVRALLTLCPSAQQDDAAADWRQHQEALTSAGSPLCRYLLEAVGPALAAALTECAVMQPKDPTQVRRQHMQKCSPCCVPGPTWGISMHPGREATHTPGVVSGPPCPYPLLGAAAGPEAAVIVSASLLVTARSVRRRSPRAGSRQVGCKTGA